MPCRAGGICLAGVDGICPAGWVEYALQARVEYALQAWVEYALQGDQICPAKGAIIGTSLHSHFYISCHPSKVVDLLMWRLLVYQLTSYYTDIAPSILVGSDVCMLYCAMLLPLIKVYVCLAPPTNFVANSWPGGLGTH